MACVKEEMTVVLGEFPVAVGGEELLHVTVI